MSTININIIDSLEEEELVLTPHKNPSDCPRCKREFSDQCEKEWIRDFGMCLLCEDLMVEGFNGELYLA